MSKIVCDQLLKLTSCCLTKRFLKRLILLQELSDAWLSEDDVQLVIVKKPANVVKTETLQDFAIDTGMASLMAFETCDVLNVVTLSIEKQQHVLTGASIPKANDAFPPILDFPLFSVYFIIWESFSNFFKKICVSLTKISDDLF